MVKIKKSTVDAQYNLLFKYSRIHIGYINFVIKKLWNITSFLTSMRKKIISFDSEIATELHLEHFWENIATSN